MADPKDGEKRQVSFYVEGKLIERLDEWLANQKPQLDRSHVVNTLLRRFLAANAPEIKEDQDTDRSAR